MKPILAREPVDPDECDEPTTAALLLQVLDELARIRGLLEPRRDRLSRADRDRLATLLPAVAGAIGSDLFLASEIVEHRSPAVTVARGDLSARALGRLLTRAEGVSVDGYLVVREGIEADRVIWRVRAAVPQFLKV